MYFMKKARLILIGSLFLLGCDKIEQKGQYLAQVPVFETMESIRAKANAISTPRRSLKLVKSISIRIPIYQRTK
jgi:uncharacterized protein YcfL